MRVNFYIYLSFLFLSAPCLTFATSMEQLEKCEYPQKKTVYRNGHTSKSHTMSSTLKPTAFKIWDIELNETIQPSRLEQQADEYFEQRNWDKAASYFIAAAIQGHIENRRVLYDLDPKALEYIQNKDTENLTHLKAKLLEQFDTGATCHESEDDAHLLNGNDGLVLSEDQQK